MFTVDVKQQFNNNNLPRKSVVRLTDRPDMTLDVYRGRKTTIQQIVFLEPTELQQNFNGSNTLGPRKYVRERGGCFIIAPGKET